jgi:hypothetical protein
MLVKEKVNSCQKRFLTICTDPFQLFGAVYPITDQREKDALSSTIVTTNLEEDGRVSPHQKIDMGKLPFLYIDVGHLNRETFFRNRHFATS